jgi:hypothetical protein
MREVSVQAAPQAASAATHDSEQEHVEPMADNGGELVAMDDYHYADSSMQRRAGIARRMTDPAPPNRTGLPDTLKNGVEALSGVSLDQVKVHYNSPRPAQLQALAYAQGRDIYLAPGQERHLPHEAWHAAQQASGRVRATMQMKSGVALNDDQRLEQEADAMGQAAMRYQGPGVQCGACNPGRQVTQVVQRLPEDALALVMHPAGGAEDAEASRRLMEKAADLKQTLINARNVVNTFPMISQRQETYTAIKAALYRKIATLLTSLRKEDAATFIQIWNQGLASNKVLENYTPTGTAARYRHVSSKPFFAGNPATTDYLKKWAAKKNAEKSMTPQKKMASMLPLFLSEPDLPEDVKVALKLFFGHTANFMPENHLGRDFRSTEHGSYYRSSNDPIREGNTSLLRANAKKRYGQDGKQILKGKTFQVINPSMHQAISDLGSLNSNIDSMEFITDTRNLSLRYAVYTSSNSSGTGATGMLQNVYKTVQTGTLLDSPAGDRNWPDLLIKDAFTPLVGDDLSRPAGPENYHDLLISDRSRLVQEVTEEIRKKYDENKAGVRVVPVQSATHASLILELAYPADVDISDKKKVLSEATWRELFIKTFNDAARRKDLQTRVTHRGSFGFLFPTASSVGDPVRIWPGLAPPEIFKELVFSTLDSLAMDKAVFPHMEFQTPEKSTVPSSPADDPVLHMEALKAAVRYAQDVMRETLVVKGPVALIWWVEARLQRNLMKARFLLSREKESGLKQSELEYVKAAQTIENLMEYSYLLEALLSPQVPMHDPYPDYLRKKLSVGQDPEGPAQSHTFYLDSGMQAITCAHLLARKWAVKNGRIGEHDELPTVDLYSYFEYAKIDKSNLHLLAQNRSGYSFLDKSAFDRKLSGTAKDNRPAIIAADLNPVLTSGAAKAAHFPYVSIFKDFARKSPLEKKSDIIPVIDVTNSTLDKAAALKLGEGYENFIVVESLSKHQQLGADKFTMGRMTAVGSKEFIEIAVELLKDIEKDAYHRLPATYRLRMDRVFYGDSAKAQVSFAAARLDAASQYDQFMDLMGLGEHWGALDKKSDGSAEQVQQNYQAMKILLDQGMAQYRNNLLSSSSELDLQKAFNTLPPADQRNLQRELEQQLGVPETDKTLVENPFLMGPADNIGIANAGNTCYLAAALNTIAFTPQAALFQARPDDLKAGLRAMIWTILIKIRLGVKVEFLEIAALLSALDHAKLLEGPNALVAEQRLNAQRDPAEVMEYLLDYFGIANDPNFQLEQIEHKRIDFERAAIVAGNAGDYTAVDNDGHFSVSSSDWMIKLPLTGADDLFGLMTRYLAAENTPQLTVAYGDRVVRGPGTSAIGLGPQAPLSISFQLVRWEYRDRRVRKERRAIGMPHSFDLNGFSYVLKAVIYHRGDYADSGHYTSSTHDDVQGWQYRDDDLVENDADFSAKKDLGYIYTYVKGAPVTAPQDDVPDAVQPDGATPDDSRAGGSAKRPFDVMGTSRKLGGTGIEEEGSASSGLTEEEQARRQKREPVKKKSRTKEAEMPPQHSLPSSMQDEQSEQMPFSAPFFSDPLFNDPRLAPVADQNGFWFGGIFYPFKNYDDQS